MNFYKCAVAGLSIMAATFTVSAQEYTETLTVGTYKAEYNQYVDTITPGQAKYIPVNVSLSQEGITGLQFDIRHSAGISLTKKNIKNPDMMPASDQVIITPEVDTYEVEGEQFVLSRVMVVASKSEALKMMEGTLMQIEIAASEGAFNRFPKLELEVENIVMTAPGEGGDGIGLYAPDMSSYVVMGIDQLSLSCPDENLEIMPGGECTITVAMDNSVKVAGLETDIVLPEGFTLKGLENNDVVTFCERAEGGDQQVFDRGDNVYHLLAFRYDGENLTNELTGNLFTFTVVAPENLEGNDFNVTLDKFVISFGSMENTISYDGKGCTISIANGKVIELEKNYEDAKAQLASLREKLEAAVAEIAETCPDVAEGYDGTEMAGYIDSLEAAIEDAYNNGSLSEQMETVNTTVAQIEEMISQYVEYAKADQKAVEEDNARKEANQAAYEADLLTIDELQAALDEAVIEITANYPDFDVETAAAEVQALIDAQKAQAEAALEAVAYEGTYENTVDSAAVLAAIDKMMQSAIETGIGSITAEELGNARIYTTTGVQVAEPVRGAINIVVREDGKVLKLHIK